MSIYTEISKKIGLVGQPLSYPTMEAAIGLKSAVEMGNVAAFEHLFKYHRFLPSPKNAGEQHIQMILEQAFQRGSQQFQEEPKPQLTRGQLTTAGNLSIGDRFYKASDKKKKVLQMVEHETKKTDYQTYNHWCQADDQIKPEAIIAKTPVVFLRHAEQPKHTDAPDQLAGPVHA